MPFGQFVIGPPGSGKTTYCNGMSQFLRGLGRKVVLVNLDPANDVLPYKTDVDVTDLVCLEAVMAELKLGPNGGLVYCMEFLQQNLDWLKEQLEPFEKDNCYFIFDCPGQVELFTLHTGFKEVVDTLTNTWHYRLTAVHLVDAHLCTEPSKYISALLLSLSTMLHLELPHINILSKVDLLPSYGELDFNLDFYTEVHDLSYLVHKLNLDPSMARFRKLTSGLCDVVQDYGLVSFVPLAIQDKKSVQAVLNQVDKANGAVYAALEGPQGVPVPAGFVYGSAHRACDDDLVAEIQEKYVNPPSSRQQQQQQQGQADKAAAQGEMQQQQE